MRKNGLCIANVLWLHCWEIREADSLPARKFMKPIADWLIAFAEKDPNSYPTKRPLLGAATYLYITRQPRQIQTCLVNKSLSH